MPLDTGSKRRSSVGLMSPWLPAPPSPTDSPGTIDQGDRAHVAYSYSGIAAQGVAPVITRYEWRGSFNRWHRSATVAV
jgi:hypothetical protein